jgi:hypothetical protein
VRDLRWPLAIVASIGAAVVVTIAVSRPEPGREAVVRDSEGDVFGGTGPDEVRAFADLAAGELTADGDGRRFVLRLHGHPDRAALGDGAAHYDLRMESGGTRYVVRIDLGATRAAAVRLDTSGRRRPFVLDAPRVTGSSLVVELPDDALEDLPDGFTWGVVASSGGAGDRMPADLAARFPQPEAAR